jgi:hypothetical protein
MLTLISIAGLVGFIAVFAVFFARQIAEWQQFLSDQEVDKFLFVTRFCGSTDGAEPFVRR